MIKPSIFMLSDALFNLASVAGDVSIVRTGEWGVWMLFFADICPSQEYIRARLPKNWLLEDVDVSCFRVGTKSGVAVVRLEYHFSRVSQPPAC